MRLKDLTRTITVELNVAGDADDKLRDQALAFHLVSEKGKTFDTQTAKLGGKIKLDPSKLKKAARVMILPADTDLDEAAEKNALRLSVDQLLDMVRRERQLVISSDRLIPIFPFWRCLDGSVRKCWWWPIFQRTLINRDLLRAKAEPDPIRRLALRPRIPAISDLRFLPFFRCKPVCVGRIEIYRRRCCLRIEIVPFDIIDICERLKRIPDLIPRIPPIPPVPPRPGFEEFPFGESGIFKGGALDDLAVHAESDVRQLEKLPFEAARKYVLKTPRLLRFFYDCSTPVKVAEGVIGPDGQFTICFPEWPILLPQNCHMEYAFKVIQPLLSGGGEITVYDGVAANKWYHAGDDIRLTTYHPLALDCDHPETEGDDVMLDLIGQTDSWHLNRVAQNGSDSTVPLGANGGLAGVSGSTDRPGGLAENANWGGHLQIVYFFPDSLKSAGARFYRLSLTPVNNAGVPNVAQREYIDDPMSWQYYDPGAGQVELEQLNHPADPSYYKIPYRMDKQWLGNRFHAVINTAAKAQQGKFILMLELYEAAGGGAPGGRLVPNGALDQSAGDTQAAFTYAWKERPGNPTTPVDYAALSHVLWWDNRDTVAEITDTTVNGVANNSECQFIEAPGTATIGAQILAYHPEPKFLSSWTLWWQRGLSGPLTVMDSDTTNHTTPHATATETVATLLDGHTKCAFSYRLHVYAKTWNGISRVGQDDSNDQASFALENTTP